MAQKLPCKVDEIISHGDRVYSIILRPSAPPPRFRPGQFLHLALDPFRPGDFWPESRVFSIATPPSSHEILRITYAVKGSFTARMESELRPGRDVWIKLPYGEFTVDRQKPVCLLAGGTGITAFSGFLSELPANHTEPVFVCYGARRPNLLIYRSLVEGTADRCRSVHAYIFSEELTAESAEMVHGRIDVEHVWKILSNPAELTHYIAGPPTMGASLRNGLRAVGLREDQIIVDAWD